MKKDYYKILEVAPNASAGDIKKSYRRLAIKHHPDKNNGNKVSEAHFKEVLEAYRVLSDEKSRSDYNFRTNANNYNGTGQKPKGPAPVTAQTLLHQTIELKKKVTLLDPYRMNKVAVFQQIEHLLSRQNLAMLKQQNDVRINKKIIDEILVCARYLPYVYVEKICFQLAAIAGTDNGTYQRIYQFSKQVRLQTYWNKYKVIGAIVLTLIFLYLIFRLSSGEL